MHAQPGGALGVQPAGGKRNAAPAGNGPPPLRQRSRRRGRAGPAVATARRGNDTTRARAEPGGRSPPTHLSAAAATNALFAGTAAAQALTRRADRPPPTADSAAAHSPVDRDPVADRHQTHAGPPVTGSAGSTRMTGAANSGRSRIGNRCGQILARAGAAGGPATRSCRHLGQDAGRHQSTAGVLDAEMAVGIDGRADARVAEQMLHHLAATPRRSSSVA